MNASTSSSTSHTPPSGPADQPIRFSLAGPSRPFDPARQAIRPDIADFAEAEHHFAPHYAKPTACLILQDCNLLESSEAGAAIRAALTRGSAFALLDLTGNWAWGYAVDGHIVGYLPADAVEPSAA